MLITDIIISGIPSIFAILKAVIIDLFISEKHRKALGTKVIAASFNIFGTLKKSL